MIRIVLDDMSGSKVHELTGQTVTVKAVREALAQSKTVHYTGHHTISGGGQLQLSGGQTFGAAEVNEVRPNQLVFLNGCSTGHPSPDGGADLPQYLLERGASAVVATYWDISDIDVSDLLTIPLSVATQQPVGDRKGVLLASGFLEDPDLVAKATAFFDAESFILPGARRRVTAILASQFYSELMEFRTLGEALCVAKRYAFQQAHHKIISPVAYLLMGDPTRTFFGSGGLIGVGRRLQDRADLYSDPKLEAALRTTSSKCYESGARLLESFKEQLPVSNTRIDEQINLIRGLNLYQQGTVVARIAMDWPLNDERATKLERAAALFREAGTFHPQDDWLAKEFWMKGMAQWCRAGLDLRVGKFQSSYDELLEACESLFASLKLENAPSVRRARANLLNRVWNMITQNIQVAPYLVRNLSNEKRILEYFRYIERTE
jgi:hypothetical protein